MPPRNRESFYEGANASSAPLAQPEPSALESLTNQSAEIRGNVEALAGRLWRLLADVNNNDVPPRDGSTNEDSPVRQSLLPRLGDRLNEIDDLLHDMENSLSLLEKNLRDTNS